MPLRMCAAVAALNLCLAGMAAGQDTPDAAAQKKLLEAMQRYADRYVSNLPNFLCVQVTQQFEGNAKGEHWHRSDTLTSRLVFNHGREERRVELVNNKPVKPGSGRHWHAPLTTEGEFGMLIDRVLGPSSSAIFHWKQWDVVRGRRVAVFDYAVAKEHSTLSLTLSDSVRAYIPYEGSVYGDPDTGAVWRIEDSATDIPPEIQTKSIATRIDYDEIAIGGSNYLLPVEATVRLNMPSSSIRNEIQFRNYRKFESDSTITFGTAVPDNTSKSQPQQ